MRIPSLTFLPTLLLSPLTLTPTSAATTTPSQKTQTAKLTDQLLLDFSHLSTWFRSNGGTLDSRIQIAFHDPRPLHRHDRAGRLIEDANDVIKSASPELSPFIPSGEKIRGLVARGDIPANTLLMSVPPNLMLRAPSGTACDTIQLLVQELTLEGQSKWHPYLSFIHGNANSAGGDIDSIRVPTLWDRNSAAALIELQGLPPTGETHRHVDWFVGECLRGRERERYVGESGEVEEEVRISEVESRALLMHLTRSVDLGFVPIYDLMNHHNGLINTYLQTTPDGTLQIYSLTPIPANQPIYNTYSRSGSISTVDLFHTHGFVEDYPQLWRWNDEEWTKMHLEDETHAHKRYASNTNNDHNDQVHEPNTHHYEILVVSPTLAALSPTKQLVQSLGNDPLTTDQWTNLIQSHHSNLHMHHVRQIATSAKHILEMLPTTIAEDWKLIPEEKKKLEKVKRVGRMDVNKADRIQAMEFRVEFKKALRLVEFVVEGGVFYGGGSEL